MPVQEVDITDLSHDGRGVAHVDGKALFVAGGLEGRGEFQKQRQLAFRQRAGAIGEERAHERLLLPKIIHRCNAAIIRFFCAEIERPRRDSDQIARLKRDA